MVRGAWRPPPASIASKSLGSKCCIAEFAADCFRSLGLATQQGGQGAIGFVFVVFNADPLMALFGRHEGVIFDRRTASADFLRFLGIAQEIEVLP